MLEILQLYVSGFWVWLGLTIGLGVVIQGLVIILTGFVAALRGSNVNINQ